MDRQPRQLLLLIDLLELIAVSTPTVLQNHQAMYPSEVPKIYAVTPLLQNHAT